MAPLLTSSRTISGCWRAALDYLDAAVLRLSDAVGRRYAQVVLAASRDHETGLRHPTLHQHGGDGVGPALGQSLVVIGRAGGAVATGGGGGVAQAAIISSKGSTNRRLIRSSSG